MIYAFNLTCHRDWELRTLMLETYTKYSGFSSWSSVNTDVEYPKYHNGAGWEASMIKMKELRTILEIYPVKDTDFVLSVDSDVVFTSSEVFKYVVPEYGIIGTRHKPPFNTALGLWGHMSGALIFIRGDIASKIAMLQEPELNTIRQKHFKGFDLTENEDVVLSYLCAYVGANYFDLGSVPDLTSGDFEGDVEHCYYERGENDYYLKFNHFKSFYHLNYCPTQFLGEPITGKWDIPKVLKMKRIEL